MLTVILCLCLVLSSSAQLYSSTGLGYPGTYGNMMGVGSNYMGNYSPYGSMSPYGSPYGMSGLSGGMNSLYGHSMLGNGMGLGSYGMGMGTGYGSPYNRLGSTAASTNKPFLPMPIAPQMPIQPVRSQSFGYLPNNNNGIGIDPNCFH